MLHSTGSLKFRKWEIDGANGELLVWRQFQVNAGEGQSERLRKPQGALDELIGEFDGVQ